MTYLIVLPIVAVTLSAAIIIRIRHRYLSTEELRKRSHPEMLGALLPYARRGDYDRLVQIIGGFGGLICMYQACGAIATLVNRYAREGNAASPLAEQAMIYAICARILVLWAMAEYLLRSALPAWPAVFTASLAHVYCDMACTLEALETHA